MVRRDPCGETRSDAGPTECTNAGLSQAEEQSSDRLQRISWLLWFGECFEKLRLGRQPNLSIHTVINPSSRD